MRRSLPLLIASLFVFGCYGDEQKFAHRKAKLDCKRLRECDQNRFVDEYNDDLDRCIDEVEDTILDIFTECEYDPEKGRDCIHETYDKRKTCGSNATQDIANECELELQDLCG